MAKPDPTPIGSPYQGSHGAGAPNNWESRNAYDLPEPVGTPVYAPETGVVGPQIGYLGNSHDTGRFAGQRLHLITAGNEFYLAHLSKITVKAGDHVQAGQLIGYTGKANGVAHLHFASKNGDPLTDAYRSIDLTAHAPAPDQTAAAGTAAASTQPTALPQYQPPPLTSPGAGPIDPRTPGTPMGAPFQPQQLAQNWQQIAAASPNPSPETMAFLQNAQTAAGG